ncbi:cysteine hydrolase family protein [Pelomonas sp. KK5]|uniref:cysteine hydrolase family protein n=1 Tax=Pelomonas sp. KK5 TaxID=1855730 RepID=UPI00097C03D3|nr:cysteine hydrolase family protein [Pelomonas sp. KK5]
MNTTLPATGTALLVIDVQQGLCTGRWAAHDAAGLIERINAVMGRAREAGVPVVLIQHEDEGMLTHGSADWQLADGLVTAASDMRLRKTVTDSFHRTDLHEQLQALGVERLVICGLQSDFCVDTTTRSAMRLGYPVTLMSDGHSTVGNGVLGAEQIIRHHGLTLSNIESFGPRTTLVAAADIAFPARG